MMKLKDHPKFKEDLARYQNAIADITDEAAQQECTELLMKFIDEVYAIDFHHDAIFTAKRLPEALGESRTNLATAKRKLEARLVQYKARKLEN